MDSQSRAWVTRRQIWQAFVQESIRSIGSVSKINLELGDQLSIDEVTLEAFSILGQKGQIRPAHGHECAECTQPYKAQSEFIAQQDPAATVEDEIQHVPVLKSGSSILAESPEDNMDVDADMDVDYAAVKMVVMDGIVMGPTHCAYDDCTQDLDNSRGGAFCAYHNIHYGARCLIAWTKFDKAESPTNILQFLEDVYPTEESRPAYICIDKACLVLRTSIANKSWEMWSRTSRFIVDSYHYINHRATDYLCRKWCNPAPLDGSAPNLVVVATDNNGKPYYQRAFNTQASLEYILLWRLDQSEIYSQWNPQKSPWIPVDSCGFPTDSQWNPQRVHRDSLRSPWRIPRESTGIPRDSESTGILGIPVDSTRIPVDSLGILHGLLRESLWTLCGFHWESVGNPQESTGIHGDSSGTGNPQGIHRNPCGIYRDSCGFRGIPMESMGIRGNPQT
ncbi:hypothetical protein BD779DRAFT_1477443 [Infundibulicybe gibba]|nr:hypothetical protein BD779DRAFT_1477443 [Infundibulicybe gibba]